MVKVKTSPYNPFDYLESEEEINEYLSAAFNDEDPHVFLIALGYLAKKRGMGTKAPAAS
ncbi:MAG: helix-turn-helix domain-containing transcriptional regulator [Desulfoprunum sp.]|jgi:probable addiction module antidote protein